MPAANVLVVDDDSLICWAISRDVSSIGFPAHVAGTMRDAFARIRENRIDVVFLDVHLPDGNGLESLEEIRAGAPGVKIVVMSGSGEGRTRQRALAAGAVQYLEKPFDMSDVRAILWTETSDYERKRRYRRYLCRVSLRIAVEESPGGEAGSDLDHLWGRAADVGGGGIRLRTTYPLKPGQRVRARPVAGNGPCLRFLPSEISAEVVWVSREDEGVVAGLRFDVPPIPGRIS